MATDATKKVSVEMLNYYDKKIKQWVLNNAVVDGHVQIVFDDFQNFPEIGENNVLYIDDDTFYRWDNFRKKYIEIISSSSLSGSSGSWKEF